jgi:hypothetical protein
MIIDKNMPIYASKKHTSSEIIAFSNKNFKETKDKCDGRNISWFGNYKVAQEYGTERDIRQWETTRKIKMLAITADSESYFVNKFLKSKNLTPITDLVLSKITYDHPYINSMNTTERSLYEFKIAFGYVTIKEQYEFMKLFDFLLGQKYITLVSRNTYVISSYKLKMYYYRINILKDEKMKYQRLSIYHIDKVVLRNLCKIVYSKYDGMYQPNQENFWNPNFLLFQHFRKNIEEYILFRPQEVLEPVENVEKYIIEKFIEFFKDELMTPQTVINGGYGIKKVLEHRYHAIDAIDTNDIDVMVGGCTLENLGAIMKKWDDKFDLFLEMIGNPNIKKYYKDFKGKFYPQFNYNGYKEITLSYFGVDLIDIMFTNYVVEKTILDKKSKKARLPLKKLEYYLDDLIKLFYQTNIDGINHDLYKKRNPLYGIKKEKGQKIIVRIKLLCSFLEKKSKYKKLCNLFTQIKEAELKETELKKIAKQLF